MNEAPQTNSDEKGAKVKFPPPFIFILLMIVGAGISQFLPVGLGIVESFRLVGGVFVIAGLVIIVLINSSFKRVGTAIEPWKPTTQLLTSGFYAWSRNPIYLAFCLITLGIGILLDDFWILISFIPSVITVYYVAIAREEAYLEQKFGEQYKSYQSRVRRWL